MKYYLAPLHGITNLDYRRLFDKYFLGIDKYFIPFLNPSSKGITPKEEKEIDPSSNQLSKIVVPQIISKNIDDTIWLINHLKNLGYKEINLNFGCPSPTVTSKGKGCGMLKDLSHLDNYLTEVFKIKDIRISIKLRLGLKDENEFENIIKILNKYDILELIIHPRTKEDKYIGPIHFNYFDKIKNMTSFDIIYNGEIKNKEDLLYVQNNFPFIKGIMLGRGIIAYPTILENIDEKNQINKIKNFYNELSKDNIEKYGWNNSKFYHKEIWACLINFFEVPINLKKKLFKAEKKMNSKSMWMRFFHLAILIKILKALYLMNQKTITIEILFK